MEFPDDWLMEEEIVEEATTGTAEEATAGARKEVKAATLLIEEDPNEEVAAEMENEDGDAQIIEEMEIGGPEVVEENGAEAKTEIGVMADATEEDEEDDEFAELEAVACVRLVEIVKRAAATAKPGSSKSTGKGKGVAHQGTLVTGLGKATVENGPHENVAVARRVVALNRKGFWQPGSGIDVRAITALRKLEQHIALKILSDLEERGATIRNPSAFVQMQVRTSSRGVPSPGVKGSGSKTTGGSGIVAKTFGCKGKGRPDTGVNKATSQAEGTTAAVAGKGLKRPLPQAIGAPPAKRIVGNTNTGTKAVVDVTKSNSNSATNDNTGTVKIPMIVAQKLKSLQKEGIKILAPGVRALAELEPQAAVSLLESLTEEGHVQNPTKWVLDSLAGKAQQATTKIWANVAKAPLADIAAAKAPLTKVSAAKAPVVKVGVAKAPAANMSSPQSTIAKASVGTPAAREGVGKPPVPRDGLEFEQLTVQSKLQSLNERCIWQGSHPLDEAALAALLGIDPGRAHEILDLAEEEGPKVKDPSFYVRKLAIEEMKRIK